MRNPILDDWVDNLERPWQKSLCRRILALARESLPAAKESLKWSSPAFDLNGPIIWFFCAKDWVHLAFPRGILLNAPAGTWAEAPDTASKGKRSMRFRFSDTLPEALIRRLLAQAKANNQAGYKVDYRIPKPGSAPFELSEEWMRFLQEAGRLEAYRDRPDYQQRGWVRWIEGAKTQATRDKRAAAMLAELRLGQYMPSKAERDRVKPGP